MQKALREGSHCGGKVECRQSDPPQAENPASRILIRISFSYDIVRKVKLIPGCVFFIINVERKKKEEPYESLDYQLKPKKRW